MGNLIGMISAIGSILGVGTGAISQAAMIRQQLRPPTTQVAQAPVPQCPPNTIPTVIVDANGQHQVCMMQAQR